MKTKKGIKLDRKKINISEYYELYYIRKISREWITGLKKDIKAMKDSKQETRHLGQLLRIVIFAEKASTKLMRGKK